MLNKQRPVSPAVNMRNRSSSLIYSPNLFLINLIPSKKKNLVVQITRKLLQFKKHNIKTENATFHVKLDYN